MGAGFQGKRVVVIGLGATGVQTVQEVATSAEKLTVFVRMPSYYLPPRQEPVSKDTHDRWMPEMGALFENGRKTPAGFPAVTPWRPATENAAAKPSFHDHMPDQRERFWEALWRQGTFAFARNNYIDVLTEKEANLGAYEFWEGKVRARKAEDRADVHKRDILAPGQAPYHILTKRVPLEVDFYDVFEVNIMKYAYVTRKLIILLSDVIVGKSNGSDVGIRIAVV